MCLLPVRSSPCLWLRPPLPRSPATESPQTRTSFSIGSPEPETDPGSLPKAPFTCQGERGVCREHTTDWGAAQHLPRMVTQLWSMCLTAASFRCCGTVPPSLPPNLPRRGSVRALGRVPPAPAPCPRGSRPHSTAAGPRQGCEWFLVCRTLLQPPQGGENRHLNICICLDGFLCDTGLWELGRLF